MFDAQSCFRGLRDILNEKVINFLKREVLIKIIVHFAMRI